MKIKTIFNKINVTRSLIRVYLSEFFRKTKFDSQYVYVLTKVSYNNGHSTLTLGKKILIDRLSIDQRKTYIDRISDAFSTSEVLNNKDIKVNKVMICYIETNKEYYDSYLKELMMSKDFE